jgi:hypothetical protein
MSAWHVGWGQNEQGARLGCAGDIAAEVVDDAARLDDHRRVAGRAFGAIEADAPSSSPTRTSPPARKFGAAAVNSCRPMPIAVHVEPGGRNARAYSTISGPGWKP